MYVKIIVYINLLETGMNNIFQDAKWIWHSDTFLLQNQYCDFIEDFTLSEICSTNIYISVCSDYILWINGIFADNRAYSDYPNSKSYDKIDITRYLKTGKNRMAISAYNHGENSFSYIKTSAGLIYISDNNIIKSGNNTILRINPCYRQGDMEKISGQLGYSFEYNSNFDDNWQNTDYIPDKIWQKVSQANYIDKDVDFFIRPIPKLKEISTIKSKVICSGSFIRIKDNLNSAQTIENDFLGKNTVRHPCYITPENPIEIKKDPESQGIYIIADLERESCGYLSLEVYAKEKNAIIDIGYGQHLDDGRVRTHIDGRNFAARYIAKKGNSSLTHRFQRFSGRYLELHTCDEIIIKKLTLIPADYPAPTSGRYESSNTIENLINETCIRTLRLSMHEHFEDTPWREQALYAMDSRNQALCNYYAFADYNFIESSLRLFLNTYSADGFFEITAPSNTNFTIPCFTFAWVLMLLDHLLYSGNYEFIQEMLPTAKDIIKKRIADIDPETGLLTCLKGQRYWNYVEWSYGMDGYKSDNYSLCYNAFYIMALEAYINLAQQENTDDLKNLLDNLREDNHRAFWNSNKNYYQSFIGKDYPNHYAQLSGALAILAKIAPEDKIETIKEQIADNTNDLVPCTISMCLYKYEALLSYNDKYYNYVFNEIEKIWGGMLMSGCTTFWETISGGWDFDRAGSLCHGWSAIPLYFYYAYKAGIKPISPGIYISNPKINNFLKSEIITPKGKKIQTIFEKNI